MAFLPVALAVAGAASSAAGAISGSEAQGANASYQAQIAKNNATIASQNAAYATQAGIAQTTAAGLKSAGQAGAIKSTQSANGLDVNRGSDVDVQVSQRELGNLDAQNVMQQAALQAYAYRNQATSYTSQSQVDTAEANEAPIEGIMDATGGLLGSASTLPAKWLSFQQSAAPATNSASVGG